jgi:hypothetical protein
MRRMTTIGFNRRRYLRSSRIAGAAIAMARGTHIGTSVTGDIEIFVVGNLSAGGALLVGAHHFSVGDELRLVFQVGDAFRPALSARVVRVTAATQDGQPSFAVRFKDVPASLRDALDHLVWASVGPQEAAPLLTLIVHAADQVRLQIERELATFGRRVVAFRQAADAIGWLGIRRRELATMLVDAAAQDLHDLFVAIESGAPGTKNVLVAEPTCSPPTVERLLASGAASAVLWRPWSLSCLTNALLPSGQPLPAD